MYFAFYNYIISALLCIIIHYVPPRDKSYRKIVVLSFLKFSSYNYLREILLDESVDLQNCIKHFSMKLSYSDLIRIPIILIYTAQRI